MILVVALPTFMQYHYIAIEGNIGAGKTTLAHLLARELNARLVLEEFADNPFLEKFYENPHQYAFPTELFFMAERYKQLKEMVQAPDLFNTITVSDYLFRKSLLFAAINLPEEEYKLYQKLFEVMYQNMIHPDILIYLHAPVSRLQQNIKKRNRSFEQQIPDDYLYKIQTGYTNFMKQQNIKTLLIDVSHADILNNPKQLKQIIDALEAKFEGNQNYLTLR